MNQTFIVEKIRSALVISLFSRGWSAALALFAVPLYLRFLGVEAYGVVGVFTSLSILVGFLDLGLGATLTRELARFSSKANTLIECRDSLRTFELAYVLIALMIGSLIVLLSGPVAQYWVKAQDLERSAIANSLALAGIALACQWPTNLYNAGFAGIHKQVQLGVATIFFGTFRVSLTLVTVWMTSSLESFFWAQMLSALLQSLGMRWLLWNNLQLSGHSSKPRLSIIRRSLRFAGGMAGITFTSIILTQTDKVILSNILSLTDFGVYVVAGTLATGIYIIIGPMFSVIYPRFSSLTDSVETKKLVDLYHSSSQTMAVLVIPIAFVIAMFADEILYLWTGDIDTSTKGALTLGFLIAGNAINGLMNIPFAVQLAFGWTRLAFWLNVVFIIVLAPGIWWGVTQYGAPGGAAVWLMLNSLCLLIVPHLMHSRVLTGQMKYWYLNTAIKPLAVLVPFIYISHVFPRFVEKDTSLIYIFVFWMILFVVMAITLPKTRLMLLSRTAALLGRV